MVAMAERRLVSIGFIRPWPNQQPPSPPFCLSLSAQCIQVLAFPGVIRGNGRQQPDAAEAAAANNNNAEEHEGNSPQPPPSKQPRM